MMRRAVVLGPLLLYATGCVLRPFTPAVSVGVYGQDTSDAPSTVTVSPRSDVVARWQLPPANPWASYQKLTLVAALEDAPHAGVLPDIGRLQVVEDARRAAIRVAAAGLPSDTMWIVDLRGAASVIFGAALSRRTSAPPSLVMTFNNWPAESEVIPAEETLAALVLAEPHPPDPLATTHVPVFLLDSWRLAYREVVPDDDVTDNRYFLNTTDLPSAEALRAQGIRRVVYVVEDADDADTEEDDLNASFVAYREDGISIYMVDLKTLSDPFPIGGWDVALSSELYVPQARATLVEDPAFYARARGGFGGVQSRPSPFTWHGSWGSSYYGGGGG